MSDDDPVTAQGALQYWWREATALRTEVAKLRAALEFYADRNNWRDTFIGDGLGWAGWERTFDQTKLTTEQHIAPGWEHAAEALAPTPERGA